MLIAVLSGFLLAIVVPLVFKLNKRAAGVILSLLPLGLFVYYLSFFSQVASGAVAKESFRWIPSLGVSLSFVLDGLSLTFALIISGIGFAVFLYASYYLKHSEKIQAFYVYILIFMASMLGVVTCDNSLGMFVFWELTSISSFLLIGFHHEQERSRYAALQALLVTATGGLALLAGFILLGQITSTFEISQMAQAKAVIAAHPYYTAIIILFALGAFTKSAQFPFHFWLPNAMEAPTPVSAYLHSATMVKAGVFLLAKFLPILGGTELWQWTLAGFGAWTMLMASVMALKQTDLKKLLAYSTVSVLGTLTMLIGIGGEKAIPAMIVYLVAHALYKGSLFLVAGAIDHSTGTRDIRLLSGLKKYMPITMIIGLLAALSGMGIIPFVGFVGKEMLYEAALNFGNYSILFIIITVVSAVNIFAVMARSGIMPFFGEVKHPEGHPHESPIEMWLGPIILAVAGLVFGLIPSLTINNISSQASIVMGGKPIHLALWHGLNTPFLLSLATIAIGAVLTFYFANVRELAEKIKFPKALTPSQWYDWAYEGMLAFAEAQTKFLQNGHLRYYIATIVVTFVLLAGGSFVMFNSSSQVAGALRISLERSIAGIDVYDITMLIIIAISSIFAITANGRLTAIASMGITGAMISIIYIIYGAPDLAMTQLAIETLSVILFALVLYKLPRFAVHSSTPARIRDLFIAMSFGLLFTMIIIFISAYGMVDSQMREYFAQTSYLIGHGKNIVNVILVDFRGLDTMGEITVLSIAAVGVYSLLQLRSKEEGGDK